MPILVLVFLCVGFAAFQLGRRDRRTAQGEGNLPLLQTAAALTYSVSGDHLSQSPDSRNVTTTGYPERQRVVVRPAPTSLWKARGWTALGTRLIGYYRCRYGAMQGRVDSFRTCFPKFYVKDPPVELGDHEHAACFQPQGDGWYFVHFGVRPTDPDSGIRRIEQILEEILDPRRRLP